MTDSEEIKTDRNKRAQSRYDELMRHGRHGHYENLHRVVQEEIERDRNMRPLSCRSASGPHIKAKHIDGPVLVFRDGQMHWLTPWERLLFAMGLTDAEKLEQKLRPDLQERQL